MGWSMSDVVCLKSTVRLDLLDSVVGGAVEGSGTTAPTSGNAIATVMTPDIAQISGAALMATFRPPDDFMKRMVIKARYYQIMPMGSGHSHDIILNIA